MVNVFNEIKDLLVFESEDDFYYLQILQRKKENPQLGSNSRVIKNYYIKNLEYIEKKMPEIIELCTMYNARAMLRLNRRSYRKTAFKALQNMANSMANGEFQFCPKSYDRAVGNGHNDKVKKWIVDLDGPDVDHRDSLEKIINAVMPEGDKILKRLPTKNGMHLITTPFNIKEFEDRSPVKLDIHKDNPINLFIP